MWISFGEIGKVISQNLTDPQQIADRFGKVFVKGSFVDYSSVAELDAKLADESRMSRRVAVCSLLVM